MNTTRRDILKYFGAGTIIAPLAGDAVGRLIEPPKIELITPQPLIIKPFRMSDIASVNVTVRMRDGSVMEAATKSVSIQNEEFERPHPFEPLIHQDVFASVNLQFLDKRSPSSWMCAGTIPFIGPLARKV